MKGKSTSKIFNIIRHEYLLKIRSKGFIIGTLFGPLILVAFLTIPALVAIMSEDSTERKLAVVDETGLFGEKLVNNEPDKFYIESTPIEELKTQVLDSKIDGFLLIPANILEAGKVEVYTRGGGGLGFTGSIRSELAWEVRKQRLLDAGASDEILEVVNKGLEIETNKLTEEGEQKDYTEAFAVMGYVLGFMIYGMMFMYGGLVMRGVIEEKSNRIVEVIASSAKPFEIMFGKVVGIGAVGLTQVLCWIILAVGVLSLAGPIISSFATPDNMAQGMAATGQGLPQGFEIPEISPWIGVAFVFYFLSGYFIYASLFAAVGSAVDQEQDAQQLQAPVTLPIILPILFIFSIMQNPDSVLATVLSLFPLFSPILMIVRIAATEVPFWQIALSVVLMIGTFIGALWVSSRIYRIGIMMTGRKPAIKDLIKWARRG